MEATSNYIKTLRNVGLAILFIFAFNFCEKSKPTLSLSRYVTSKSGLNLRKAATVASDKIVSIPFNSMVEVTQEAKDFTTISGIKGKWAKIKYNNFIGWVFDGFLAREKIVIDRGVIYKLFAKCTVETELMSYASKLYLKLKGNQFELHYLHCEGTSPVTGKFQDDGEVINFNIKNLNYNLKFKRDGNKLIPQDVQQAGTSFFQCGQCEKMGKLYLYK